jgi:hypothetical protein
MIYSHQLTLAENRAIAERYAPYHRYAEFWIGFIDYQHHRTRNPYGDSVGGQSWDRGAEAAMQVQRGRQAKEQV